MNIEQWFAAHDRYHKASARYNERLLLVRAERERGNWTMKLNEEYADLNAAQSAALAADNELYDALKALRLRQRPTTYRSPSEARSATVMASFRGGK